MQVRICSWGKNQIFFKESGGVQKVPESPTPTLTAKYWCISQAYVQTHLWHKNKIYTVSRMTIENYTLHIVFSDISQLRPIGHDLTLSTIRFEYSCVVRPTASIFIGFFFFCLFLTIQSTLLVLTVGYSVWCFLLIYLVWLKEKLISLLSPFSGTSNVCPTNTILQLLSTPYLAVLIFFLFCSFRCWFFLLPTLFFNAQRYRYDQV